MSGKIGFFLGPVAAALVVRENLKRTGHKLRANKVLLLTVLATIPLTILLMILSAGAAKLLGFVMEIGTALFFPPLQEAEFNEWQAAHPDVAPSSGWSAIGAGLLGLVLFFAIAIAVGIFLPDALISP
ncbi:MAG: hypothetical protein ACRD3E_10640 [Terriglobales bacterium]